MAQEQFCVGEFPAKSGDFGALSPKIRAKMAKFPARAKGARAFSRSATITSNWVQIGAQTAPKRKIRFTSTQNGVQMCTCKIPNQRPYRSQGTFPASAEGASETFCPNLPAPPPDFSLGGRASPPRWREPYVGHCPICLHMRLGKKFSDPSFSLVLMECVRGEYTNDCSY